MIADLDSPSTGTVDPSVPSTTATTAPLRTAADPGTIIYSILFLQSKV